MKKKKHRQIPGGFINLWGVGPSYLLFTGSGIPANDIHEAPAPDQREGADVTTGDGSAAGAGITGAGSGIA